MAQFILPELESLSDDSGVFPLLANARTHFRVPGGRTYPIVVPSPDGPSTPLFLGGVVTVQELEQIVCGIAGFIAERHRSGRFLIIGILEGARWFCTRLLDMLARGNTCSHASFELAFIKISSYRHGISLGEHKVIHPLALAGGKLIGSLSAYDGVLVADDLVDSSETFNWLIEQYLPTLEPAALEAYFLLEKKRPRKPSVEQSLQCNLLNGRLVPDQWIVGYGPDISLEGPGDLPSLHFFRGELPGGFYAFNSSLVEQLTGQYHQAPSSFRTHWTTYITDY
jgi:hypoxanthine-guanine phosphoribosyltransferase